MTKFLKQLFPLILHFVSFPSISVFMFLFEGSSFISFIPPLSLPVFFFQHCKKKKKNIRRAAILLSELFHPPLYSSAVAQMESGGSSQAWAPVALPAMLFPQSGRVVSAVWLSLFQWVCWRHDTVPPCLSVSCPSALSLQSPHCTYTLY